MKTRIINTELYRDKNFRSLSHKDRFVLIFLLTNEYLEALPVVAIDLELLAFHTSVTEQYLSDLIPKLSYFQLFYIDGFLIVGDLFTYANYRGGKTDNRKNELYEKLPDNIKDYVNLEGVIAQSLLNHCSIVEHIKHKPEIINHKSENIKHKPEIKNGVFVKPTQEEIKTYCLERKNNINPEKFRDYYESNGWKVGKNPMKDWKACVRNWEKSDKTVVSKPKFEGEDLEPYKDLF
jgi:hypothetical protein